MTTHPVAQELAEKVREACAKVCRDLEANGPAEYSYVSSQLASMIDNLDLSPFTQAMGAGLPELEPLTYSPCTYLGQDGKTVYSMTPTNYGEWMRVSDYRRAATALQERADATARQRDAECERANEFAARLKFDKTFEQRADNLQRELTEARKDAEQLAKALVEIEYQMTDQQRFRYQAAVVTATAIDAARKEEK